MNTPVKVEEITAAAVTAELSRGLRSLIGPGRRWSYAAVASRTGIDVRTLKAYVQGTACPDLVRFKRLLAVIGPEVGAGLNRMQGMLPRVDASPPEFLDLAALRQELTRASSVLGAALGAPAGERRRPEGDHAGDRAGRAAPGSAGSGTAAEFRAIVKAGRIDKAAVVRRLGYRLRRMIGEGCRWSLAEVAQATGIDRRTLAGYVDGRTCPNLTRYLRLTQVLGPESGYELALMLGWRPRHRPTTEMPRQPLEALWHAVDEAVAAIDGLAAVHPDRAEALIAPTDRAGRREAASRPSGARSSLPADRKRPRA